MTKSVCCLFVGAGLAALAVSGAAWAESAPDAPVAASSGAGAPPPGSVVSQQTPNEVGVHERAKISPTKPRFDPIPVEAAGWSRPRSDYFFDSRWEENWTQLQKQGEAPPLKAMPLFGDLATLTLSAEERFRAHTYENGQVTKGNNYTELQNRAIIGADLHITDYFRLYGELGHGDLTENGHPNVQSVSAKQINNLSLQQLFADANYHRQGLLAGVMVGRMEWTDAPTQLVSPGNGPNLHATWEGYRLYLHTDRFRLGYFQAYLAQQNNDELLSTTVNHEVWMHAINAGVVLLNSGPRENLFLEPIYIETYNYKNAQGNTTGPDHRYTFGTRLKGSLDRYTIDWMGYKQTGDHIGRSVSAWLFSLGQTVKFTPFGYSTDFGIRFDGASGGGGLNKTGEDHLFNPIYTDKGTFGECELFTYQNMLMMAPNMSVRINPKLRTNLEYDFVYRENDHDAFYTPSKPYAGTQNFRGSYAGGQVRWNTYYDLTRNWFLRLEIEQFSVGGFMRKAGYADGYVVMPDITFRY